jgi:alpha-1,2-mannosyltransferase
VLWCAVQALMNAHPDLLVVIYTGDQVSQQEIISKAKERFGIDVNGEKLLLVRLRFRWIVEARCYPVLTLLGQSLGTGTSVVSLLPIFPKMHKKYINWLVVVFSP